MNLWHPNNWKNHHTLQQPVYPDENALQDACNELSKLPPLVTPTEIENLKKYLAEASLGKRFILQGGDCSESFADCCAEKITNKLKVLLQMSLILVQGLGMPISRIGRIAGQYAKPRSEDLETLNGVSLPSYRGDLINDAFFSEVGRVPNPQRMLQGYGLSSLTLNYIRALVESGFADLHNPDQWQLPFLTHAKNGVRYHQQASQLLKSIKLLEILSGGPAQNLEKVEFFTSHEALLLHYEAALTRKTTNGWYNLSTHFPWIGMRTGQIESGHVEYIRGIKNPVAIKVGPNMQANQLLKLIDIIDPHREPGKLTLIHRFGISNISDNLPILIKTVQQFGYKPLWICDPMHGNTHTTDTGIKTREFKDISQELELALKIHQDNQSILGGVHLELTGEYVTECVGGALELKETDLNTNYRSTVDPRLNAEQALEMAFVIAEMAKFY